jgi:hypothetical protein
VNDHAPDQKITIRAIIGYAFGILLCALTIWTTYQSRLDVRNQRAESYSPIIGTMISLALLVLLPTCFKLWFIRSETARRMAIAGLAAALLTGVTMKAMWDPNIGSPSPITGTQRQPPPPTSMVSQSAPTISP